jgi:hypothetical protein
MGAADGGQRMTRGARHAVMVLAAALVLMMAASPTFTVVYANSTAARQDAQARTQAGTIAQLNAQARVQAATIAQLRAQLLASCGFAADIGGAPLPAAPRPSKLGVSIIADSRAQWLALRCPGSLPPPSPGLVKWGPYYHKPVS